MPADGRSLARDLLEAAGIRWGEGRRTLRWRLLRAASVLACLLALASVAILVGVSLLQPQTDPLADTVSLLVLGTGGYLVAAMMVAAGASIAIVAWALHATLQPGWSSRVASGALGFGGLQVAAMGFFPTDPGVVPETFIGYVHATLSGVGLTLLPVSFVLLSLRFGREDAWRRLSRPALWVAWCSLASSVAYGALSFLEGHTAFAGPIYDGLAERILVGTIVTWLAMASVRLWFLSHRRLQAGDVAPPPSRLH